MQTKLQKEIENVLKTFPEYWENEELLKHKVIEDLRNYRENLITSLLSNRMLKETYSIQVGENVVFKLEDFISLLRFKNYWLSSYTKYTNEIGLTSEGKYLKYNTDIILDFPYKDTILEGGMTKEDNGRVENFYHRILAKEEIDILLSPKTLTNIKKIDSNGEHHVTQIEDDDNLIIKGNNLSALHTLKERYAGKVKLIYIDPPYYFDKNKDSDTFPYNSNFKLSTWLTFMKNRLEIAKELLADDGAIFVSIGKDGQAYLKILMDEIFGKENFVETFIWRNTDNANSLGNKSRSAIESIHAYEKIYQPNKKWIGKVSDNDDAPLLNSSNGKGVLKFPKGVIKFNIPDGKYEAGEMPKVTLLDTLIVENGVNKNDIRLEGRFKWGQENLINEINKGTYFIVKTKAFSIRYQKNEGSVVAPEKYIDSNYLEKVIGVGTYEDSNTHLSNLKIDFKYSKPESLIAFILNAVTVEGDLVLDFFMGSATTPAVAHKMNRQYIGIEQMDYINTVSVPRLKKVIEGEQGGISKEVGWRSGGSFIYAELQELNQIYVDKIQQAATPESLSSIFAEMKNNAFLDFKVNLDKVTMENTDFSSLSLEEQKDVLIKVLDGNQLYLNYSEIEDEQYVIPESVKQFNHAFYESGSQA